MKKHYLIYFILYFFTLNSIQSKGQSVTAVSISPKSVEMKLGESYQLNCFVIPATALDKGIVWSSGDKSVATVDTNGVVYSVSVGKAFIIATANDGGYSDSCTVKVINLQGEGYITRDYWTGINGRDVNQLTDIADYPDNPTGSDILLSLEAVDWGNPETFKNWADKYGQRIYGYLHPPETGEYTFWISSDEKSELYLSTDTAPDNKTKIAFVEGQSFNNEWDKYPAQKSTPITLTAGEKYFIEIIHKEYYGGDNLVVRWAKPGQDTASPSQIIPGKFLSPQIINPNVPVSSVKLDKSSLKLAIGQTSDLTETVWPINAADKSVAWSSSNSLIATVDAHGIVSALSVGDATITVTTNDGDFTADCTVSVSKEPANEGHLLIKGEDGTVVENRVFTSIRITNSTNITVRNCKLIFNKNQGALFEISNNSSNITVENCDLDGNNNSCAGINVLNVTDLLISNNDIHNIADDGISLHYVTNVTLQDNKIHHLIAKGTDGLIDGPCYNGHSDGIELNDVHYFYMYRNIIYDIHGTSCFIAGSFEKKYPSHLYIENNVFIGNGVGFVVYFGTIHTARVYNNIIYNGIFGGLAFNGVNTDIDFKNNICQTININHFGGEWDPVEHRFDHNLISDRNTWGGYVLNPNDVLAEDPMWVNYPAYTADDFPVEVTIDDFRLRSGSPAIDAGISSGAPETDIIGASRPQGSGYEIGVFETEGIVDNESPTTPDGLKWSDVTGEKVDLQWNASVDNQKLYGYDLYENDVFVKTVYDTIITINGLFCNTSYTYKIKARDLSGNYSGFSNSVEVTTTSECAKINLALNKPVTVSEESPGDEKENINDDDFITGTYWAAEGFPQWAEIDLGAECDISSFEVYPHKDRDYQYIIEGKPEGGDYSTIVDRSDNTEGGKVITDEVSATARYIKLSVSGANSYSGTWCSIRELKVFGVALPQDSNITTSIDASLPQKQTVCIYPNPTGSTQSTTVELSGFHPNEEITLKIIGILGNTIHVKKSFVNNIGYLKHNLNSDYPQQKGVYFIIVESKTNRSITKLIKK